MEFSGCSPTSSRQNRTLRHVICSHDWCRPHHLLKQSVGLSSWLLLWKRKCWLFLWVYLPVCQQPRIHCRKQRDVWIFRWQRWLLHSNLNIVIFPEFEGCWVLSVSQNRIFNRRRKLQWIIDNYSYSTISIVINDDSQAMPHTHCKYRTVQAAMCLRKSSGHRNHSKQNGVPEHYLVSAHKRQSASE